jgi:MFS family permease
MPAPPSPTLNDTAPRLGFWRHAALAAFWFASNLHWGALLMLIVPSQATRLAPLVGVNKAEVSGLTIGLGAIIAALVPPLIGAWSDRCRARMGRRRPFVLVGTAINVVALLLFHWAFTAASFPGYIAAWLLINLGNNIATGAFSGIIPDVVPQGERGFASGMMAAMQQFGMIGGFATGILATASVPPRDQLGVLVIAGVLVVITAITVGFTPEKPITEAKPFGAADLIHCFWVSPRQYPDFAWVWVQRAVFTLGWNLVQANLLFFMQDVIGQKNPELAFGLLAMLVLVAAVPTGLWGGALSDRMGRKRIIFLSGMVMAVTSLAFAGLGALPADSRLTVLYGLAVVWGLGYGAYISVDWALGTDVLPNPDDAGKDMGVWHLAMTIPQSIAAPAAALLLRPFALAGGTSYRPFGYTVLFIVAAGFMFLCAILIWKVKKAR